jgi:hypothetical protein
MAKEEKYGQTTNDERKRIESVACTHIFFEQLV